jgi:hypothetical protein
VNDDDGLRQKIILIRHYFPGVDIDNLSDEDFARISNDAEWLHKQQVVTRQVNALGLIS